MVAPKTWSYVPPETWDYAEWKEYREKYGAEAYKWRRLAEELERQITNLYVWADNHGVDLPHP